MKMMSGVKSAFVRILLFIFVFSVGFQLSGATKNSINNITISGPSRVDVGAGAVFSCTGENYYGEKYSVSVKWSVSNSSYAYFSGNTLYATSAGAGKSVTVIAEYGNYVSDEKAGSPYRVARKTVSISSQNNTVSKPVTPGTSGVKNPSGKVKKLKITGASSVSAGNYETYVCTVTYSDKRTENASPEWSVSKSSVGYFSGNTLYINSRGGAKSIKITARFGGKKVTKTVKINKQLAGISITGKDSVKGKKSITLKCKAVYTDGSQKTIKPVWSLIANYTLSYYVTLTSGGKLTYKSPLSSASTVQVKAVSGNYQAVKTITLEAGNVSGGGSGSMRIYGSSSLKTSKSATYSLYYNGAKVTSSSVKWGKSGNLLTVYDQGSTARAVAGKPSGKTGSSYVTATYKGKTVRFKVTVSR